MILDIIYIKKIYSSSEASVNYFLLPYFNAGGKMGDFSFVQGQDGCIGG